MNETKSMFEWKIRLGDLVTILSGFVVAAGMYSTLNARVATVEQATAYQVRRDDAQDQTTRELKTDIKDALRDLSGKVDKISDKLDDRKKQ
jgi:peptidoglycan hydrolase CwlO-like protein